jgi:hypothetical protein
MCAQDEDEDNDKDDNNNAWDSDNEDVEWKPGKAKVIATLPYPALPYSQSSRHLRAFSPSISLSPSCQVSCFPFIEAFCIFLPLHLIFLSSFSSPPLSPFLLSFSPLLSPSLRLHLTSPKVL